MVRTRSHDELQTASGAALGRGQWQGGAEAHDGTRVAGSRRVSRAEEEFEVGCKRGRQLGRDFRFGREEGEAALGVLGAGVGAWRAQAVALNVVHDRTVAPALQTLARCRP
eukprot:3932190-Rhodomonas_salina.2